MRESKSSGGPAWLGYVGAFLVYVVVKAIVRRFVIPFFGAGFGADAWASIEFIAIAVFGLSFAIWFAIMKIRLRKTLGSMARVAGIVEILILLVHAGMAAVILSVIISEAAANPQLDDAGTDRLLDPWMKRASLASAACHAVWIAVTVVLFASIRNRSDYDWAEDPGHSFSKL